MEVMFWVGMARLYWVSFVHTDIHLDLGPLNYVIVTPRFHRWHHVPSRRGGQNYAGFFAFYDLIFGTYYYPKGEVPKNFGNGHKDYPEDFWNQLLYPFRTYFKKKTVKERQKA